jgi:hypothetical protein
LPPLPEPPTRPDGGVDPRPVPPPTRPPIIMPPPPRPAPDAGAPPPMGGPGTGGIPAEPKAVPATGRALDPSMAPVPSLRRGIGRVH